MTALTIILLIFLAVLVYLVFAPFYLEIDSIQGILKVRFHKLASAEITMVENSLFLKIFVAGWRKEFDLLNMIGQKKDAEPSKPKKKQSKKSRLKMSFHRFVSVLKSFQIKKCFITFDSGDMPTNGILYPIMYGIKRLSGKDISINFWDENEIVLVVRNSIARIAWAAFSDEL